MPTDNQHPQNEAHPRVVNYARSASRAQANGNSIERQRSMARDWSKSQGYTLHESDEFVDCGVSAFAGNNVKAGSLGILQQKLMSGDIPRGSILLVESFDRLIRDEFQKATEFIVSLVNNGLIIVTLCDGQIWDQKAMASLQSPFSGELSRLNKSEGYRSRRVRSALKTRRANTSAQA